MTIVSTPYEDIVHSVQQLSAAEQLRLIALLANTLHTRMNHHNNGSDNTHVPVTIDISNEIYPAIAYAAEQRGLSPEAWISYLFPNLLPYLMNRPAPDKEIETDEDRRFFEEWNKLSVWEQQGIKNPLEPKPKLTPEQLQAEMDDILAPYADLPALTEEEILELALSETFSE